MYHRRTSMPKSSGGALAGVVVSIFFGFFIIGLGLFFGNLFSNDSYKDWVEVTATQTKVDCEGLYCPGFDSDPEGCKKCTARYEYVYAGETYYGLLLHSRPSQTGQLKVLVNPKRPYSSVEPPKNDVITWVFVCVEFLLAVVLFFWAWRCWQWYRLYKTAEKDGRLEELLQQLEDQGLLEREER